MATSQGSIYQNTLFILGKVSNIVMWNFMSAQQAVQLVLQTAPVGGVGFQSVRDWMAPDGQLWDGDCGEIVQKQKLCIKRLYFFNFAPLCRLRILLVQGSKTNHVCQRLQPQHHDVGKTQSLFRFNGFLALSLTIGPQWGSALVLSNASVTQFANFRRGGGDSILIRKQE